LVDQKVYALSDLHKGNIGFPRPRMAKCRDAMGGKERPPSLKLDASRVFFIKTLFNYVISLDIGCQ